MTDFALPVVTNGAGVVAHAGRLKPRAIKAAALKNEPCIRVRRVNERTVGSVPYISSFFMALFLPTATT
jgi:hypothetical protein